jgi:superfamily II DNA/RNA helicase/recombinational DNA repair protein RecR
MTNFEPISASDAILESLKRYMATTFNPRRELIEREYLEALKMAPLTNDLGGELYKETRRIFKKGKSLDEFISKDGINKRIADAFKYPLYEHQAKVLELTRLRNRNAIVATGTGSGKTESFLIPIVESLLQELVADELGPGIRAVIVYPMNALANDQVKRMREIFSYYPEITFGRFVGATLDTAEKAMADNGGKPFMKNEISSRQEMVNTPPNILITNYAMLERLLLLPKWAGLFTGHLKWLVMDEVHSYSGTKAVEISMLIRRLKSRTKASDAVRCIAASATLGSSDSEQDRMDAAKFASQLFDELFSPTDLVTPAYEEEKDPGLIDVYRNPQIIEKLKASNEGIYHLFVRNPGGAFMCFGQHHPSGTSRITLQQKKWCPICEPQTSRLIEIGACRNCGVEYLIAKTSNLKNNIVLSHVEEFDEAAKYFQLLEPGLGQNYAENLSLDELLELDEEAIDSEEQTKSGDIKKIWWCHQCSLLSKQGSCAFCNIDLHVEMSSELKPIKNEEFLRCQICKKHPNNPFGPVQRPVSSTDALTSVIASSLVQSIPPEEEKEDLPGKGRKLLAFSDSRQNAAYFAPYLNEFNFDSLRRRMLYQALVDLEKSDGELRPFSTKAWASQLMRYWQPLGQNEDNPGWARTWVRAEQVSVESRLNLSGTGLINLVVRKKHLKNSLEVCKEFGLDETDSYRILNALIESALYDGVLDFQTLVEPNDELFAPKQSATTILENDVRTRNCVNWFSTSSVGNKRTGIARKAVGSEKAIDFLKALWESLFKDELFIQKLAIQRELNSEKIDVYLGSNSPNKLHFCEKCRKYSWWPLNENQCASKNCEGILVAREVPDDNHYKYLYRNMDIATLESKEHTAQWTAKEAINVQNDFIEGKINVLSCSTTFEMGVDIGSILAVLCRNVPPTPANYVQRAGRAGRAGGKALVVTFARKRSHDSQFANDPTSLIKGRIPVPSIAMNNVDIVSRHIYASALSHYLRETDFLGEKAKDFFDIDPVVFPHRIQSFASSFIEWLNNKPDKLKTELLSLNLPESVSDRLDFSEWGWVKTLIEFDDNNRGRILLEIVDDYRFEIKSLTELAQKFENDSLNLENSKNYRSFALGRSTNLEKIKSNLEKRQAIELLANGGFLPKYGFPVDVGSLAPSYITNGSAYEKVELSRDLSIAISEYSPGSQLVAGGNILTSLGVSLPSNLAFETNTFSAVLCENCGWFFHQRSFLNGEGTVEMPKVCESCESPFTKREWKFLQPRNGFIASVEEKKAGVRARPKRMTSTKTYVSSVMDDSEDWEAIGNLRISDNRNAKMLTISNDVFVICRKCGWSVLRNSMKIPKDHENPRTGQGCKGDGPLGNYQLGHEFRTDVFRIEFETNELILCICGDDHCLGSLESAGAAIAKSAVNVLGVASEDLAYSVSGFAGAGKKRIMIFDTTPGGAGLASSIKDKLNEVIERASYLVSSCNCEKDSSCYVCLRNYRNQGRHEHLTTAAASLVLSQMKVLN